MTGTLSGSFRWARHFAVWKPPIPWGGRGGVRAFWEPALGSPAARAAAGLTQHKSFSVVTSSCNHFQDRPEQVALLRSLLHADPQGLLVMVGPLRSGKTTLLKTAVGDRLTALMNLRKFPSVTTIEELTRLVRNYFRDLRGASEEGMLQTVTKHVGSVKLFGMELQMKAREGRPHEDSRQESHLKDFAVILDEIEVYLEHLQAANLASGKDPSTSRPVIVLGGANKMMSLLAGRRDGKRALKLLFKWALHITAGRKLCHVVMTSTDGLFVTALEHEFAMSQQVRTVRIPDPTHAEAEVFLSGLRLRLNVPHHDL
eukprot:RCo016474